MNIKLSMLNIFKGENNEMQNRRTLYKSQA
jgi:hypothetical protein